MMKNNSTNTESTSDKPRQFIADCLISAPYLCLECNSLFGICDNEEIKWGCAKGFEMYPKEYPPCEEE